MLPETACEKAWANPLSTDARKTQRHARHHHLCRSSIGGVATRRPHKAETTRSVARIASVPSFELWLLLHFENIQPPLHRDDVMRRLRLASTTPKAMLIGPVGFGGSLAQVASPAKQVSQNINAAWII